MTWLRRQAHRYRRCTSDLLSLGSRFDPLGDRPSQSRYLYLDALRDLRFLVTGSATEQSLGLLLREPIPSLPLV